MGESFRPQMKGVVACLAQCAEAFYLCMAETSGIFLSITTGALQTAPG